MLLVLILMCVVPMFQEVELKYHRLCQTQGDQEAATSEDSSNNPGVFQSAAQTADGDHKLTVRRWFSDGIQR